MNYIGEFIKKYRGDMSLREFADKCGISHTHLDSIEKGFDPRTGKPVRVTVETLKKIASAMNMSVNDLLIQSGDVKLEELNFDNAKLVTPIQESVKIPVLGRIPAGMPFEAIEDQYAVDFEEIPRSWLNGGNQFFALKLDGDSMEPEYHVKDIVIFKKTSTCESGQDCCIKINGFDATFKRVKKQENGIMVIPLNENNSTGFSATFFTNDDIINKPIEIIGVVKQIRRNI